MSDSDPYAPAEDIRPTNQGEVTPTFLPRLRRLEASQEVVDEIRRRWDDLTNPEKRANNVAYARMTPDEVKAHLSEMEAELQGGLLGVVQPERYTGSITGADLTGAHLSASNVTFGTDTADTTSTTMTVMPQVPEGSAAEVLEWVGKDKQRARAALTEEERGQRRKTLIAKLKKLL